MRDLCAHIPEGQCVGIQLGVTAAHSDTMKERRSARVAAMGIDDVLKARRDEILRIARKHGVTRVRVVGSLARGEASETSDVDLLIEVQGPTPPWFPGGLVAELEALLGRRVDVVEAEALREDLRADVLEEAVAL